MSGIVSIGTFSKPGSRSDFEDRRVANGLIDQFLNNFTRVSGIIGELDLVYSDADDLPNPVCLQGQMPGFHDHFVLKPAKNPEIPLSQLPGVLEAFRSCGEVVTGQGGHAFLNVTCPISTDYPEITLTLVPKEFINRRNGIKIAAAA